MADAYPLQWPEGWPRTPVSARKNGRYQFKRPSDRGWREPWTFAAARDALVEELAKHSRGTATISTNFPLSREGLAAAHRGRPDDQGVAVYFMNGGRPVAMACDRFDRAEENFRSLTLALEAMRQLERHGGGVMVEKAFSGFAALPAPPKPHEILAIRPDATGAEIRSAWRRLIAAAHPDQGGSEAAAAELNAARDAMLRELNP